MGYIAYASGWLFNLDFFILNPYIFETDDLSWWRYLFWWILNLAKGKLTLAAKINIPSETLEDYKSGKFHHLVE